MKNKELEPNSLAKNCNEALILAILAKGRRHGYQLALEMEERSGGYFKFNHGTLYPILHKLEKDGMIGGTWKQEGPKRKRKLYSITRKGERHLAWQKAAWERFCRHLSDMIGE